MATLETDPYCLTDDEAARLVHSAPWQRLAVLGDSLAAGVGDDVPGYPSGGWAATVARVLARVRGDEFAYLNLGERNLLAAEVHEQQLGKALAFRPDLAVVLCGGNDLLRRRFDLAAVVAEIGSMVTSFRERTRARGDRDGHAVRARRPLPRLARSRAILRGVSRQTGSTREGRATQGRLSLYPGWRTAIASVPSVPLRSTQHVRVVRRRGSRRTDMCQRFGDL